MFLRVQGGMIWGTMSVPSFLPLLSCSPALLSCLHELIILAQPCPIYATETDKHELNPLKL